MLRFKKSLGQNFLINDKILPTIIKAAEIKKDDVVVEVGSGHGILTQSLLDAGAKVFAIEKDYELVRKSEKLMRSYKNLTLVHQDALWFDLSGFDPSTSLGASYKVVANLPFNIASPLIRKFLETKNQPELMVLMVQKEVAEKITAKPGNSERGILTVAAEFYAESEIIQTVPKESFRPQPKVDAAIIKIKPHLKTRTWFGGQKVESEFFFRIVKAGFSAKRRQIHNSLTAGLRLEKSKIITILKKSKIEPQLRAEDLTLDQWLGLCQIIKGL